LVASAQGIPGRIRLGDINADNFPDVLLTLKMANSDESKSYIFMNHEGRDESANVP
jgi:hypothetical protein